MDCLEVILPENEKKDVFFGFLERRILFHFVYGTIFIL